MGLGVNILNKISKSKAMTYLASPSTAGAAGAAAKIALISNLSKDGVNCYYYVTQSLKNEKIPEEKRKFVAALDLSNGILNMITQTALGILLMKPVDKFFDKKIGPKHFSLEVVSAKFKKLKEQNKLPEKASFEEFEGIFSRRRGWAKAGLGVLATLIVTQIIAKRIIVPLIATPMASAIKQKFEEKGAKKTPNAVANSPKLDIKETPDCFKPFK